MSKIPRKRVSQQKVERVVLEGDMDKSLFTLRREEAKRHYPRSIVLFLVGDSYRAFGDDVDTVSKSLGLVPVHRHEPSEEETGGLVLVVEFPCLRLHEYVDKLLEMGLCVVVCEEVKG